MHRDEHGAYDPPVLELGHFTVVHDRARNLQVMRINGVAPLPIGAEVELTNPNLKAVVVGVRLLAGLPRTPDKEGLPVHICLEVDVPEAYWDAQ